MARKKRLKDVDAYLSRRYYDPDKPAAFTSVSKLFREIQRQGNPHNVTFDQVKNWGLKQDAITLNPSRIMKKKPRLRVISGLRDTLWDVDLLQLNQDRFKKANDSIAFLLVCVDILSRFARVVPLKSKNSSDVLEGFKRILPHDAAHKLSIRSDSGGEFDNKLVKDYMKKRSINLYFANSSTKANLAESFIKSLKRRLFRLFQHRASYRYIDRLEDLVRSNNSTEHSSTSMAPKDVNSENEKQLWDRQFFPPKNYRRAFKAAINRGRRKRKAKEQRFEYKLNDVVRISYLKQAFQRDYDNVYSGELFRIRKRRIVQGIPVYYLRDYQGEDVRGAFYNFELRRVTHDPRKRFKIDKILKTRRRNGESESLIRWLAWPRKYDSWEKTREIKSLV